MPDYSKAKIYCIKSSKTEEVYYGSTCQTLSKRFNSHKYSINDTTSKQILQYQDAYIELIEDFPCNSRAELSVRERYYIENNLCVNKFIPGRTRKGYYEDNMEKIKAYTKAHYEANKDKIKQYKQQYRANKKSQGGVL